METLQIVMSSTATSRAPPGGSSAWLDSPGSASGTPGEKTNQSRSSTEQGTISEQQEAEGSLARGMCECLLDQGMEKHNSLLEECLPSAWVG